MTALFPHTLEDLDDWAVYMRALEAERRHARPENSKRLRTAQACMCPMSPGELAALVDEVCPPQYREDVA